MCEQGNTVTCIVQSLDEYDKTAKLELHENLTRVEIAYDKMFDLKYIYSLSKTLECDSFDIIFGSHAPIAPVIEGLAREFNKPWGVMLLDIPTDLMEIDSNRKAQWNYWFAILSHADTLIFNTHVARDEHFKYVGERYDDSNVIPYGINMMKEYDNLGINLTSDYVVSVCRLTPAKNCLQIPKAIFLMDKTIAYIAIGRDCGQLTEIKEYCDSHNIKFEHHENVSEAYKFNLIAHSAMLIYPQASEYIGGLSPFEAMYVGTPALVGDYKVLKQLYLDNSYYYDKTDEDLAKMITEIRNNRNHDKLLKSNEFVKEIASFEAMAKQMTNVFKKVT